MHAYVGALAVPLLALPDNKGSCSFGRIWDHTRVGEARAALDRVEAHRPIQQSAAPGDPAEHRTEGVCGGKAFGIEQAYAACAACHLHGV